MGKGKIFIIHHGAENYPAISNDIATPILGGSEKDVGDFGIRIPLRETTGETICDDHHLLSEFTVYYWVWQNIIDNEDLDYVGFFHYRTFLELGKNDNCDFLTKMGITDDNIKEQLKDCDAIITDITKEDFYKDWDKNQMTIIQQFNACHPLGSTLFSETVRFLRYNQKKYAAFEGLDGIGPFAYMYFGRPYQKPYFKSVFVSTIEYFKRYMDFLFTILDYIQNNETIMQRIEKLTHDQSYRLLAFFAERITALFIAFTSQSKIFKFKEVPRYHQPNLRIFLKNIYPPMKINVESVLTVAVPLVRLYNPKKVLHTYRPVINKGFLSSFDMLTKEGFWVDGMCGYLLKTQIKDSLPVFTLKKDDGEDYLYTTSEDEFEHAQNYDGYTQELGKIGYILKKEKVIPGLKCLPMRRFFFHPVNKNRHFYTTVPAEADALAKSLGVSGVEEDMLGYILL